MKLVAIPESSYNDIRKNIMEIRDHLCRMNVEARDKEYQTSQYWNLYQDVIHHINDLEIKIEDKL